MHKKAIIFDLDGTLWNSSNTITKAWKNIIQKYYPQMALPDEETIKSILGKTNEEIIENLFNELALTKAKDLLKLCQAEENTYISIYGGILYNNVENVLKELSKKYNLYIVSNCQSGYIEAFLNFYSFNHYFKDFECSGNTGKNKSDNIITVMQRNNIKHAIYVGDTQNDLEAAHKSNIQFVYAKYGFGNIKHYEHSISELLNLIPLINNIL